MPQGPQRRLVEGFAQGRVDVDDAGDVFQHRAHFQHLGEAVGHFGDMLADGLDAEQAVVGFRCQHTDEAAVLAGLDGQGTADGGQREDGGDDVVAALDVQRTEAGGDDLGLGETDGGDGHRVEAAVVAGDDLGDHLALGRALVGQHGFAGQVADGPDVAHGGGATIVNLHERPGHGHAHILQTPALGARLAADGDEDLVGLELEGGTVLRRDVELALFERPGFRTEVKFDAVLLQPFGDRIGQGLVIERQQAVGHFDDGDLGPQFAEGDAELQPDIAAADHDQLAGHLVQRQGLGRGDDVAAELQEGQFDRLGAGGEDDVFGRDGDLALGGFHRAGLGVGEVGPALDDLDLRLLQQGGDAGVQLADDAVLPCRGLGQVDGGFRGRDAEGAAGGGLADRLEFRGGVDDGLGRNAADVQAGPAEAVAAIDQNGVEAQLAATDARDIAAGAGADDENPGLGRLHLLFRSSPRTRGPSSFVRHVVRSFGFFGRRPVFRIGQAAQSQPIMQIVPAGIGLFDQFQLPEPVPFLDLPLAPERRLACWMRLEPDQMIDVVPGSEPDKCLRLVLKPACDQVVCGTHIGRAVAPAGHDVGEEGHPLFNSAHPRERGDPVLSSLTPVSQDKGQREVPSTPSPKALGPRVRGDERSVGWGVQAQLAAADARDIAAGAGADDEDFGLDRVSHGSHPIHNVAGCSNRPLMRCTKTAASWPSTMR